MFVLVTYVTGALLISRPTLSGLVTLSRFGALSRLASRATLVGLAGLSRVTSRVTLVGLVTLRIHAPTRTVSTPVALVRLSTLVAFSGLVVPATVASPSVATSPSVHKLLALFTAF